MEFRTSSSIAFVGLLLGLGLGLLLSISILLLLSSPSISMKISSSSCLSSGELSSCLLPLLFDGGLLILLLLSFMMIS